MTRQRFFDRELTDGRDATMHSAFDRAHRVLRKTTEQCLLAAFALMLRAARISRIFPSEVATFIFGRNLFALGGIAGLLRRGLLGLARRLILPLALLFGPRS